MEKLARLKKTFNSPSLLFNLALFTAKSLLNSNSSGALMQIHFRLLTRCYGPQPFSHGVLCKCAETL